MRREVERILPRCALPALLILLPAVAAAAAERPGALVIDEPHAVFADAYPGQHVEHSFVLRNTGDEVVEIVDTFSLSPHGSVEVQQRRLEPGGTTRVRVAQRLGERLGHASFRYAVISDEGEDQRYRMTLAGFVQSAYDPEQVSLDFGALDRELGQSVEVELFSREVPRLEMLEVVERPEFLRVREEGRAGVAGEGLSLIAELTPQAPEGYVSGTLVLRTNVGHHPELRLGYRAVVIGDVQPSQNPLQLGVIDIGVSRTFELALRSRSGRAVRVARVEDSAGHFDHRVKPCSPPAATCQVLELTTTPERQAGVSGTLRIYLERGPGPIAVLYSGLAVPPGTRVKQIVLPDPPESPVDPGDGG